MQNSTDNSSSRSTDTGSSHDKNKADLSHAIDIDKWKEAGFVWSGEVSLSEFARLFQLSDDHEAEQMLKIDCDIRQQQQLLWCSFEVSGSIRLTCQRCLQAMQHALDGRHKVALVDIEEQLSLLTEDSDYLMLDEVVELRQGQRYLPLRRLIEDELLLAVPLSPKHTDCQLAVAQVGEVVEVRQDNPFASLAQLKGQLDA